VGQKVKKSYYKPTLLSGTNVNVGPGRPRKPAPNMATTAVQTDLMKDTYQPLAATPLSTFATISPPSEPTVQKVTLADGNQRFQCNFCGNLSFRSLSSLVDHKSSDCVDRRKFAGTMYFDCPLCITMGFLDRKEVLEHLQRKHSNEIVGN